MPTYRICTTEFHTSEGRVVVYTVDLWTDGVRAEGYTSTKNKNTIIVAEDDDAADRAFEFYVGIVKNDGAKSWTAKLQEIKKDGTEICVIREMRLLTEADA